MPKVLPNTTELMNREARAVMADGQARNAYTDADMAKRLGICTKSYQDYRRDPNCFRLRHVRAMVKTLKLTDAEIIRFVRGVR